MTRSIYTLVYDHLRGDNNLQVPDEDSLLPSHPKLSRGDCAFIFSTIADAIGMDKEKMVKLYAYEHKLTDVEVE